MPRNSDARGGRESPTFVLFTTRFLDPRYRPFIQL